MTTAKKPATTAKPKPTPKAATEQNSTTGKKPETPAADDDGLFAGVKIAPSDVMFGVKPDPLKTPVLQFIKGVKKQISYIQHDMLSDEEKKKVIGGPDEKVRRWYKIKDGVAYTVLRYNTKKILLRSDMDEANSVYEVGTTLQEILDFYTRLIAAVRAGKYEDIINKTASEMVKQRAESRKKNKENPKPKEENQTPDNQAELI